MDVQNPTRADRGRRSERRTYYEAAAQSLPGVFGIVGGSGAALLSEGRALHPGLPSKPERSTRRRPRARRSTRQGVDR